MSFSVVALSTYTVCGFYRLSQYILKVQQRQHLCFTLVPSICSSFVLFSRIQILAVSISLSLSLSSMTHLHWSKNGYRCLSSVKISIIEYQNEWFAVRIYSSFVMWVRNRLFNIWLISAAIYCIHFIRIDAIVVIKWKRMNRRNEKRTETFGCGKRIQCFCVDIISLACWSWPPIDRSISWCMRVCVWLKNEHLLAKLIACTVSVNFKSVSWR